jgi:hypothetical protein
MRNTMKMSVLLLKSFVSSLKPFDTYIIWSFDIYHMVLWHIYHMMIILYIYCILVYTFCIFYSWLMSTVFFIIRYSSELYLIYYKIHDEVHIWPPFQWKICFTKTGVSLTYTLWNYIIQWFKRNRISIETSAF